MHKTAYTWQVYRMCSIERTEPDLMRYQGMDFHILTFFNNFSQVLKPKYVILSNTGCTNLNLLYLSVVFYVHCILLLKFFILVFISYSS